MGLVMPEELYADYLKEIGATDDFRKYSRRHYANNLIFDDGELKGFLIIGGSPHPDCDYCVCQAYLTPDSRGKGLMKETLDNFVNGHPGVYTLDVVFDNDEIKEYWRRRFSELQYRETDLPYIEHGVTGIAETFYFKEDIC